MLRERIKSLLGLPLVSDGFSDTDILIDSLIKYAQSEVVDYCHLKTYQSKLDYIVIQMVVEKYNRMGTEGTSAISNSGGSQTYIDGYSKNIYSLLNRHRRVRFV